ncbi:hypothetical protein Tcan_06834 [Toxocara canis]|uniref:Uncharacterized protein n=1 Tax=Toxocara canis TaxID=6265 RepID=A0A0B2VDM3_TOXCA|nr:hypothetical protein Tcan_06834 [Toxocara canis]
MRIPLTLSTLITVIESYFMNAPLNLGEKPILPPIRANSTHAIYFYDGVFRYEPLHAIVESAIETTSKIPLTLSYRSSISSANHISKNSSNTKFNDHTNELEQSVANRIVNFSSFDTSTTSIAQVPIESGSIPDDLKRMNKKKTSFVTSSSSKNEYLKTTKPLHTKRINTTEIFEENNEKMRSTTTPMKQQQHQQQEERRFSTKQIPKELYVSKRTTVEYVWRTESNDSTAEDERRDRKPNTTTASDEETTVINSYANELVNETASNITTAIQKRLDATKESPITSTKPTTDEPVTRITSTTVNNFSVDSNLKPASSTDTISTTTMAKTGGTYSTYRIMESNESNILATDTEAINWYDGLNDGYSEQLEIDSANETANTNAGMPMENIEQFGIEIYSENSTHLPLMKITSSSIAISESNDSTTGCFYCLNWYTNFYRFNK